MGNMSLVQRPYLAGAVLIIKERLLMKPYRAVYCSDSSYHSSIQNIVFLSAPFAGYSHQWVMTPM